MKNRTPDQRPKPAENLDPAELARLGEVLYALVSRLTTKGEPLPSLIKEDSTLQSLLFQNPPDFLMLGEKIRALHTRLGGYQYHPTFAEGFLFWEALNVAINTLDLDHSMRASLQSKGWYNEQEPPEVPPVSPEVLAQEIINGAFSEGFTYPSTHVQQVRVDFALTLYEQSSDAHLIFGILKERAGLYQEAEKAYERAMQFAAEKFGGEKALSQRFAHNRQESLWYVNGGRHYLRARAALAALLWKSKQYQQAKKHYQALLTLNPSDNQGVRDDLICLLLEAGDESSLASSLKKLRRHTFPGGHSEDIAGTVWHYTNACYQYRLSQQATGATSLREEAAQALREAFKYNKFVPLLLLAPEDLPANEELAGYSKGDATEAAWYVNMSLKAWNDTLGAMEWLEAIAHTAHLLPSSEQDMPRITIKVIGQRPNEDGEEEVLPEGTLQYQRDLKRIQYFGEAGEHEELQASVGQAAKTLEMFWKSVQVTTDECWLWKGDGSATFYYSSESGYTGSRKVDPLRLAWTLGTGLVLPDGSSQLMPTCQTPTCINAAHRQEVLPLNKVYWVMCNDSFLLGEDDRRELAWRFRNDVEDERISWVAPGFHWNEQLVVLRRDYERWRRTRGRLSEEPFREKYIEPEKYWRVIGSDAQSSPVKRSRSSIEEQRHALGIEAEMLPQLIGRYQQIVMEQGGTAIDEQSARYHLDRLFLRIRIQNACWYWDKPATNRYRLVQNGPTVEPRYLLWRLFSDIGAHPLYTVLASHDGKSLCVCPAHSDILFDTNDAAFMLVFQAANHKEGSHLTHEQVDPIRSIIHQAIEARGLPFKINADCGTDLWRSDVLAWAEKRKEDIVSLAHEILAGAPIKNTQV